MGKWTNENWKLNIFTHEKTLIAKNVDENFLSSIKCLICFTLLFTESQL